MNKDVYNFESIAETAAKALLTAREIKSFTSGDEWDFQNDRPRVELYFTLGAGLMRWAPRASLPEWLQSERVEAAWKAALYLAIVTSSDPNGRAMLAELRTELRLMIPQLGKLLNGTYLTRHKISLPRFTGDTREIQPEKGYEKLIMTTEFDWSVQAEAWALLDPNP